MIGPALGRPGAAGSFAVRLRSLVRTTSLVGAPLRTSSPAATLLCSMESLLTAGALFLASRVAGRRELTQMRRRQRALGQADTPPPLSPLTVATLYAIAAFFIFAVVLIAAVVAFPPRSDADAHESPFMWCCMTTVVLLGAGGYLLYRRAQARWARWERGVSQPPPTLIDCPLSFLIAG